MQMVAFAGKGGGGAVVVLDVTRTLKKKVGERPILIKIGMEAHAKGPEARLGTQ